METMANEATLRRLRSQPRGGGGLPKMAAPPTARTRGSFVSVSVKAGPHGVRSRASASSWGSTKTMTQVVRARRKVEHELCLLLVQQ